MLSTKALWNRSSLDLNIFFDLQTITYSTYSMFLSSLKSNVNISVDKQAYFKNYHHHKDSYQENNLN